MKVIEDIHSCVCKDRMRTHGDAEDNFADIAKIWTVLLKRKLKSGEEIGPLDVAGCMIGMKLARAVETPNNLDHWVDAGGYAVCGGGIILKNGDPGGRP